MDKTAAYYDEKRKKIRKLLKKGHSYKFIQTKLKCSSKLIASAKRLHPVINTNYTSRIVNYPDQYRTVIRIKPDRPTTTSTAITNERRQENATNNSFTSMRTQSVKNDENESCEGIPHSDASMKSSVKDKRVLSFLERIEVIQKYDSVGSARRMSLIYGCSKTQILNVMRNKDAYLEQWQKSGGDENQLRRKSGLFASLTKILYEWIQRAKAYPEVIVTDDDIRCTAKEIARRFGLATFYPHNHWLGRFKAKYQINEHDLRNPTNYIEKKSLDIQDIINDFKNNRLTKHVLNQLKENEDKQKNGFNIKQEIQENDVNYDHNNMSYDFTDYSTNSFDYEMQNETCESVTGTVLKPDEIRSYEGALEMLQTIEDFLLICDDIRGVGLICQIETHFKQKLISQTQ